MVTGCFLICGISMMKKINYFCDTKLTQNEILYANTFCSERTLLTLMISGGTGAEILK